MSEHKEKRRYTREFQVEAVRLYETSEKSMCEIEQELGITPYLLSKWVRQFRERELVAFPSQSSSITITHQHASFYFCQYSDNEYNPQADIRHVRVSCLLVGKGSANRMEENQ